MREFRFIAVTPPGLADAAIAIAASRAGEFGVLDLQYAHDEATSLKLIANLARHARGECGIKLEGTDERLASRLTSDLPKQVRLIILTCAERKILGRQIEICRERDLTVLLETSCLDEAELGEELGFSGLIAKGHEAPGLIRQETTFILLQRLLARVSIPVWAHGGIGTHTVAACYEAGAAGAVLDSQLALTRESQLPEEAKNAIARMDGSETICLGENLGAPYRVYYRPNLTVIDRLRRSADTLPMRFSAPAGIIEAWRREVKACVGWQSPNESLWFVGQDAAFARPLAERFRTTAGVIEGMRHAIETHVSSARALKPLNQGSPLARSHGTRYPIVQGPMTRVSDRAAFALKVAEGGGLPFMALALMRAPEVKQLLEETRRMLGKRPWGVGILGFVPSDLRAEQMGIIRDYHPTFALIAGGRPDQALALERAGIPTYLHVPSPGLLKLFIENGARRFVFEGRECGGHVGPRSSFVLWNIMIDTLLATMPPSEMSACHVLFAGGVHDALSSSMVATMASPLAERGARIGVLLGTAYLFTTEAVATGAIKERFQREAIECTETTLLETGPGHATRCAKSPFVEDFEYEKQQLLRSGKTLDERREALEQLNLGRLRIASKGIVRNAKNQKDSKASKFTELTEREQFSQGMYMIGQLAALRDSTCTIEQLHHEVSVNGSERPGPEVVSDTTRVRARITDDATPNPSSVAIIGMACLLPKAPNLQTYWENILHKVDAITEVPSERWDWHKYFDPDPKRRDKIYSKWGGFIDDVQFDPLRYGMPPNTLPSIEPLQLLTLEVVHAALEDAGYAARPFSRDSTSVILGVGGGISDLGQQYALRSGLPMFFEDVSPDVLAKLPEWTEDSFAGILLNVAAGRVANRFDLGGVNYTVDAACASSLAAVYLATRELENRSSDVVIVGGADTVQNPFGYLCFSKTNALSPRGRCRTFDETADGIVISEGVAVLVLKRLADAERDGDRIYAVIKSVAGSSDGRDKGLTAPRPEGQARALNRAYNKAGFAPSTVGLIEAHGTGTVAGDNAEIETLRRVYEAGGATRQSCAIGSVKSMFGHTKCTAGVASIIKTALALYHRVLPPTINVEKPNPRICKSESPFYLSTEPRPWLNGKDDHPRRAGVSAFGFGGTNFHAVLEEYTDNFLDSSYASVSQDWPCELLIWASDSRQDLITTIESLEQALSRGARPVMRDLAYTLWCANRDKSGVRLVVVAGSVTDLRQKLALARQALATAETTQVIDPRGIYFTDEPLADKGKVAFLFPGQGSQYPGMLRDLTTHFNELREQFELANRVLSSGKNLTSHIFPPPCFTTKEERAQQNALMQTDIAQPALGAAAMGLLHLLRTLGVRPEMVAGHSYGEYVALSSAGVFDEKTLYKLSEARGQCIAEAAKDDLGTMAAVLEGGERVAKCLKSIESVWIANFNAPRQTVISGTRQGIEQAIETLRHEGIQARIIPVACAFHSSLVAAARDRLADVLSSVDFRAPCLDVYSNTSAQVYPADPQAIKTLLTNHLTSPVRFADEVDAIYTAGARIFIEVGPQSVLTGLTEQIIGERPHIAVSIDRAGRDGLVQFHHTLALLACHGVSINLDRLYQGRVVRKLNLAAIVEETSDQPPPATTWLVNGGRARPLHQSVPEKVSSTKTGIQTITRERRADDETTKPSVTPPIAEAISGVTKDIESVLRAVPTEPPISQSRPSPNSSLLAQLHDVSAGVNGKSPNGAAATVMRQFQELMTHFLQTQQHVMLAYLGGSTTSGSSHPVSPPVKLETVDLAAPSNASVAEMPRAETEELPDSTNASTPAEPVPDTLYGTSTAAPDKEVITTRLLQLVSERTGYPKELLDLDQNIEADLGIDSIKRVEIVGALQRVFVPVDAKASHAIMDQLTAIKTLRGIGDAIYEFLITAEPAGEAKPTEPNAAIKQEPVETDQDARLQRFAMKVLDAPYYAQSLQDLKGDLYVVTDDEQGVAQELAERLRTAGASVVLMRAAREASNVGADIYAVNVMDPAAIADVLEVIRQRQGRFFSGVIHLLPLMAKSAFDEMNVDDWRGHLNQDVKSLFYFMKATGGDRKAAGEKACVIAASPIGELFSRDGAKGSHFPGHGGMNGLLKTLAAESPQSRCKAIELSLDDGPSALADHVMREIVADTGDIEIAYEGPRRSVLQPVSAPLPHDSSTAISIDTDSVVLLIGGARGITAEVALELAALYRPTLLLVGRSSMPESEESTETAGLTSPRELKSALVKQMERSGQRAVVADVEAAYSSLLKSREMRSNMAAMKRAGATVRYYQVDVENARAFGNLIDEIYRDHGRLDGVVYGAGVIEDKLIQDKTPDSFNRVFDPKVNGAFVLSRKLRPDSLRFLVFFSSVSGCFGNKGQADYAAANEVLNRLALYLDRQWPAHVVALNWGPWDKTGMASPEVRRQFASRGVQLIPPAAGRGAFVRELLHGAKGEAEIILGSGPWESVSAKRIVSAERSYPLLNGFPLMMQTSAAVEAVCRLDPAELLFLQDHQLDAKPVLPVTVAMELMAEMVQKAWPEWRVTGLQKVRLLKGIILDDGAQAIRIAARPSTELSHEQPALQAEVEIADADNCDVVYYRATVQLAKHLPESPSFELPLQPGWREFPLSAAEAYRDWLFHGPRFQCIQQIGGISDYGLVATVGASAPASCIAKPEADHWLIDPILIDSGPQLAILWGRATRDITALPSSIDSYRRYASLSGPVVRCYFQVLPGSNDYSVCANVFFVNADGHLASTLEGLESTGSRALNRLAERRCGKAKAIAAR